MLLKDQTYIPDLKPTLDAGDVFGVPLLMLAKFGDAVILEIDDEILRDSKCH
jgi:hypothetical protein